MNKQEFEEYISLCKKLYTDKDFKRFIMLHTLRASILEVKPYQKILEEMSEV